MPRRRPTVADLIAAGVDIDYQPSVSIPGVRNNEEDGFKNWLIAKAKSLGWIVAHFRPAMTSTGKWLTAVQGDGKGFPDLVLVRERVLWIETKSEEGRLKKDQVKWRDALIAAGEEWYLFRPSDEAKVVDVLSIK